MTLRARGVIVISAFLPCLGGGLAGAQDKPADTMELLREKARADKKLVVAKALNLTEGEAKVFRPVYNSYQVENKMRSEGADGGLGLQGSKISRMDK